MSRLLMSAAGAALLLSVATANAQDSNFSGSIAVHDTWSDVDVTGFDDNTNTIGADFSIAHGMGGTWNAQFDGSYNSVQFEVGPADLAVDVMRIAAGAFFDGASSRFGFGIGYDTVNVAASIDGYDIGAGAEFYFSDTFTLSGGASYIDFDGGGLDGGGFGADGKATFYMAPRFSLGLHLNYYDFDSDSELFRVAAEAEYMFNNSPVSLTAGLGYNDIESPGSDGDATTFEIGLKWRFETKGNLVEQDRSGPFAGVSGATGGLRHLSF